MRVAIIDDEQINRIVMRKMLSAVCECEAHEFPDPHSGLDWCVDNDPDLVIVDYMMPDMHGLEFIRRLRQHAERKDTPVLMVTADHERSVRYESLREGANDFLTKPLDKTEFQVRVRNMLQVRRSHLLLADRADTLEREVQKRTAEILARERETLYRLAKAAEFRDPETGGHILRMAHYSALIARRLGQDETYCDMLLEAAPMHDVGKLGTPDHILLKPGRLTPEEFEVMKRHTSIGHEILKGSCSPMLELGASIALAHHEKFDGTGYPNGLGGEDIPLEGRIVAVADVFDALTSARPYKPAWEDECAVAFMREQRGRHFDPHCLDAFLDNRDEVGAIRAQYGDE
jgi:putative two-component system response regulator